MPDHNAFVAAYAAGQLRVNVDAKAAARFISARMLLPWVMLPLFGIAVVLALNHAWLPAVLVFLLALGLRTISGATAPGYVLQRALADAAFYDEVRRLGLLRIEGG